MEEKHDHVVTMVKDMTANPAPLGLLGFGMTTVLLNIANAGYWGLGAMIFAMGIFYGGLAQVFAGWMEWKKGNTFGTVAFMSYGLFWLSIVFLVFVNLHPSWGPATPNRFLGWYFFFWGLFTLLMFVGTLRVNRALQVVFGTLVILFWLLAIAHWAINEKGAPNSTVTHIAGWVGIVCGLSAIYAAIAQIWNELYGRVVLPIGPAKK